MKNSMAARTIERLVKGRYAKAQGALAAAIAVHMISATAQAQQPTAVPPTSASSQAPAPQPASDAGAPQAAQPLSPASSASPVDPNQPGVAAAAASAASTTTQQTMAPAAASSIPSATEPPLEPPPLPLREPKAFIASLFSMRLEFGAGGPFGELIDAEKSSEIGGVYSDGSTQTTNPDHNAFHFGVNLEFAPLRANNVKLALRAGYLYTYVGQSAEVGGGAYEKKTWSGQLLQTHATLFGPVLYVGKRWYGSFQVLAGPIFGTLHPLPIGGQIMGRTLLPDSSLDGWVLRLGPGFGYAWRTLLLGGDLLYSLSSIHMDRAAYLNLGTRTALHTVAANIYVGLHF